MLWRQLIWNSVTFLTFIKELLDSCGYFLYLLSHTQMSLLQPEYIRKSAPLWWSIVFVHLGFFYKFHMFLYTQIWYFINTLRKFSFKFSAIFSTLSSNTILKNLRILFLYIFLSLTVPFVYVCHLLQHFSDLLFY